MTQSIRWGLIGMGRFGTIYAEVLQALPGSELVAVCSRSAERRDRAVDAFAPRRAYERYQDLLDDNDVDVVGITTHWLDHHPLAVDALRSGKHVLLEKPMASTPEQCREILAASRVAAGNFMVGHICRFDPCAALAKQAVSEGRVGRIVSMHAKRNLPKAPGWLRLDKTSPLMGDGVHDADLMMWLLDAAPTRVYARNVRVDDFTYPDIGWATLEFGDQAIGVVETNWRLPENTPTVIDARLEVVGTEGMLTIDCSHTGLTVLDGGGVKMQDTDYWPTIYGRRVGVLRDELEYFADCARSGRKPQVITPDEAARAALVMLTAERSAAEGQPLVYDEEG